MSATTDRRTRHPFHMYEAIHAQPDAFARVTARTKAAVGPWAARVASCPRIFLVGTGTSHHATLIGEHLLRTYGGGLAAHAVQAFDFALYGPHLSPQDCVICVSHRGTKQYTARSLERARAAGCLTVVITGDGDPSRMAQANAILYTVPQEASAAHTISYAGAIAALSVLAERIGYHRTGTHPLPETFLSEDLPAALRAALATEPIVAGLARDYLERRRIWLAGGGPSAVTAQEGALKIKETSYLQAEGMAVETMLHGPFQCTGPEDLFVLIAPDGAAQPRVVELAGAVREIGGAALVVSDGTPASLRLEAGRWCTVPAVPEPFTALTCLVPLQLFAYYLALERGTNPDGFRLEDPHFARAHGLVQL